MKVLDGHCPKKKKVVTGNNAPFMNNVLSKDFMHRLLMKKVCMKNNPICV